MLVVDNYDSFVYNLAQYVGQLGVETVVRRNDVVGPDDLDDLDVAGVLLSPGPGTPQAAGCSPAMVRACADRRLPLLGVCLGHQAIAIVFGGRIVRAAELLHGKSSPVEHDGSGVLAGLPQPLTGGRYHSLVVDPASVPEDLVVTAWSGDVVMGLRHRSLPIEGVQFHPESVLTQGGHVLLANWLATCGHPQALDRAPALTGAVEERRLAALT